MRKNLAEHLPLEQGLRRSFENTQDITSCGLAEHLPLEQGLRPTYILLTGSLTGTRREA